MDYLKSNPAIIISIYAAIISTISLTWNIALAILERMSRIGVEVTFYTSMLVGYGEGLPNVQVMQVTIVNKSKRVKYIKSPQLKLSYGHGEKTLNEDDRTVNLFKIGDNNKYPLTIKPEEEIVFKYPFGSGSEWMLKNAREKDTFKVIITDTTSKKYKSKKTSIKHIDECYRNNIKVPQEIINLVL